MWGAGPLALPGHAAWPGQIAQHVGSEALSTYLSPARYPRGGNMASGNKILMLNSQRFLQDWLYITNGKDCDLNRSLTFGQWREMERV